MTPQDLWCWCDDASGNVRYWWSAGKPRRDFLPGVGRPRGFLEAVGGTIYWSGVAHPNCIQHITGLGDVTALCAGDVPEPGEAFHVVGGKIEDVVNVREEK